MNIYEVLNIPNYTERLNIFNNRYYAYKDILFDNHANKLLNINFTDINRDNTLCMQLGIETSQSEIGSPYSEIINEAGKTIYIENYIKDLKIIYVGLSTFNSFGEPLIIKIFDKLDSIYIKYIYYHHNNIVLRQILNMESSKYPNPVRQRDYFASKLLNYDEFKASHFALNIFNNELCT